MHSVKIVKQCGFKLDGKVVRPRPGDVMPLPVETAVRLINAGLARPAEDFDATKWRADIRKMVNDFDRRSPDADLWDWIAAHRPDLLEEHRSARKDLDNAYWARDASRVMAAKVSALNTFGTICEVWRKRDEQQPSLLAE